jgi:putative GTP pyrophosphokinase
MQNVVIPNRNELRRVYEQYEVIRSLIAKDLQERIAEALSDLPSRPSVKGRTKDFDSFFRKYLRLLNTGGDASPPITDIIGIRIVCPFIEDLSIVEGVIKKRFDVIETERKGSNYNFKEFGYESTHLLIRIPRDIMDRRGTPNCSAAEVQIRTILQDAWAEVEHELVYKAEFTPFDDPMKRKLAAVNASLSLADTIFQEIRSYQRQLNSELGKRRESFYQKIEDSTDALVLADIDKEKKEFGETASAAAEAVSIDDLLLNALYAHNKNLFDDAIDYYSRILELSRDSNIRSLIYKHRGMAYFAQSKYEEAVEDFTRALEMDGKAYKAAYYRGVVRSVQQRYSEAVDDFALSLVINPYQAFCLFRRAQAYYHLEDYPQALADCESSLSLEPDNPPVKKFRKLLQDKLKM